MTGKMERKPVFGRGALAPITPSAAEEAALGEAARSVKFENRGTGGAGVDEQAAKPKSTKAAPIKKTANERKPAAKKPTAKKAVKPKKIPPRTPPVSQEFPDLVEHYIALIDSGEPLPNPPNPMWQKVDRHRVYSMFPVHTAAALQAFSDAKGYRQLWMGIDELLREAGLYENEE